MVAALVLLGAVALPAAAEAQARGTLQATATVVDTRQGFGALDAARTAVLAATTSGTDSRIGTNEAIATVAHISVVRPMSSSSMIVVTIDYSRN